MNTKNKIKTVLTLTLVAMVFVATSAQAATKIGIDFGRTATPNWNNITADGTIADGSVVATNGAILTGISITTENGAFWNSDGPENWVGLASNGGSAPAEFLESVTIDIAGNTSGLPYLVTIAGLNDNGSYDVVAVCSSIAPYANAETLTINGGVSQTVTRDDSRDNGTFHSFTSVSTDGSGNLELGFTNSANNPIVCGVLITANDPNLPSIDHVKDVITWSGQEVSFDMTVNNNDTEVPKRDVTLLWSVDAGSLADSNLTIETSDVTLEDIDVTVTKTEGTGGVTVVTMTLTATLEGAGSVGKKVKIDVYDDACDAGKAAGLVPLDETDINGDCTTNLADLAIVAADWLVNYAPDTPQPRL
jgi:hypothetical protein